MDKGCGSVVGSGDGDMVFECCAEAGAAVATGDDAVPWLGPELSAVVGLGSGAGESLPSIHGDEGNGADEVGCGG